MPLNADPEEALRTLIRNGANTSRLWADVGEALKAAARPAVLRAIPFFGDFIAIAVEAVIDFFVGLGGWLVLLIVVIILLALRIFEGVIINALRLIPYWGKNIANTVQGWLRWLDHLEEWAIRGFVDAMAQMVHGFFLFVGIAADAHQAQQAQGRPIPRAANGQYITVAEGKHLQWEIDQANKKIAYINYILDPTVQDPTVSPIIPAPVHVTPPTTTYITVGVPANVWNQIHALQAEVGTLRRDVTDIYTHIDRLARADTQINREFIQLSGSIHSIRAVATGWQEIEDQLQLVSAVLLDFTDTAAAQFAKHGRLLARLEPLNLLQQPGLPGLKILRQLEDTPCMCPKLPNIPRLAPELLAMYEFASYG